MSTTSPTEQIRETLQSIYSDGKVYGDSGRALDALPVGLSPEESAYLTEFARSRGVGSTIETGFAYGLSGLSLCLAMIQQGLDAPCHVAMDPMQKALWDNSGIQVFQRAGVSAALEFYEEGSQFVLPRLRDQGRSFDLGFIDGDHRYDAVFIDMYYMHHLIRPGGWILVDDMQLPAVATAVRFFESSLGYERDPSNDIRSSSRLKRLQGKKEPHPRTAIFRRPDSTPKRAWDHFEPFW